MLFLGRKSRLLKYGVTSLEPLRDYLRTPNSSRYQQRILESSRVTRAQLVYSNAQPRASTHESKLGGDVWTGCLANSFINYNFHFPNIIDLPAALLERKCAKKFFQWAPKTFTKLPWNSTLFRRFLTVSG